MNRAEYSALQTQMILVGNVVEDMDVGAFIRQIEKAHALGPILMPTGYRATHERLEALKDLARAIGRVQTAHRKLKEVMLRTEGRAAQERASAAAMLGVDPPGPAD